MGTLTEQNGQDHAGPSNGDRLTPADRSSTISPISPGTSFPFSPFSPLADAQFFYKEEDQQLVGFPWFSGQMDREKAEEILERFPNGTFLVRISSKADAYKAISVK